MSRISVLGSGFSGLSASAILAAKGHEVHVYEKLPTPGGRARQFIEAGFTFDMGPSWYWMPEVYENFFHQFGYSASDFYSLHRLDPSYRVFFPEGQLDIPDSVGQLIDLFESLESGSGAQLQRFLENAREKYEIAMGKFVFNPSLSWREYLDVSILRKAVKLDLFRDFSSYVSRYFKHPWIVEIMEFPILFLGGTADQIPAMYSLMNYSAIAQGTWYPMGGMYEVVKAMKQIAETQGVQFHFNNAAKKLIPRGDRIDAVEFESGIETSDFTLATADYEHVDRTLLPEGESNYSSRYWQKRTLAPSCLIYYIGLDTLLPDVLHHNLFFDTPLKPHAKTIYREAKWPQKPQFYLCCPSKTDPSVAPEGCDNLFILVPIAPGLDEDEEAQETILQEVSERIYSRTGIRILDHLRYMRKYSSIDFKMDYNAFKGNAYGLANTLRQTAVLKPRMQHRKYENLIFAGQLTVPGPGVPPSIISGEIAANFIHNQTRPGHATSKYSDSKQHAGKV